jgi:hypothetical protein
MAGLAVLITLSSATSDSCPLKTNFTLSTRSRGASDSSRSDIRLTACNGLMELGSEILESFSSVATEGRAMMFGRKSLSLVSGFLSSSIGTMRYGY